MLENKTPEELEKQATELVESAVRHFTLARDFERGRREIDLSGWTSAPLVITPEIVRLHFQGQALPLLDGANHLREKAKILRQRMQ